MNKHFDPLSYDNLGNSIVLALAQQPLYALETLKPFNGVGIYMLYYSGEHPAYRPLALANQAEPGAWPIYVGKAEAENARKGLPEREPSQEGAKLFNRIRNHRSSISSAENLSVNDFTVRYLNVTPTWIPLAELVAIRVNRPVWNVVVDGLGNHDPGRGRHAGERPRWDTLHPGRKWAPKLAMRSESPLQIQEAALVHLAHGKFTHLGLPTQESPPYSQRALQQPFENREE